MLRIVSIALIALMHAYGYAYHTRLPLNMLESVVVNAVARYVFPYYIVSHAGLVLFAPWLRDAASLPAFPLTALTYMAVSAAVVAVAEPFCRRIAERWGMAFLRNDKGTKGQSIKSG